MLRPDPGMRVERHHIEPRRYALRLQRAKHFNRLGQRHARIAFALDEQCRRAHLPRILYW